MPSGLRASKLQIDWREAGQARKVTAGLVDLEVDADGVSEVVLDIFPDDHSWLGLQVPDGVIPTLRVAGHDEPLLRIVVPDGEAWWVPALAWNASKRRHDNAFLRALSQFEIAVGEETLRIVTRHHDGIMLEDYLRDFRDELIWLILGQEGSGSVTRGGGADMAEAFASFVDSACALAADVPHDLREATGPMRRSKVRPNAATFRALGRAPWSQILPGRQARVEADIADNRYLRHLIQGALALAMDVNKAGKARALVLENRAARLEETGRELIEREWQEVDREVFDAQLQDYEQRIEPILQWRPGTDPAKKVLQKEFYVQNNAMGRDTCFFVKRNDIGRFYPDRDEPKYHVLELPEAVAELIRDVSTIEKQFIFDVSEGHATFADCKDKNSQVYRRFTLTQVEAIHPVGLTTRRKRRTYLEANGWRVKLDPKARDDYRQAGKVSLQRAAHCRSIAEGAGRLSEGLTKGCARLAGLDLALRDFGVGVSASPPQGLRWRLHPPHVACLAAFRHLQETARGHGLDIGALERLDAIGTLHASALYERWCLVKILSVLIVDFGFRPEEGWQERLVDAVTRPDGQITLDLSRPDLLLGARLQVQPVLRNGRRPDFRLRVTYLPKAPTPAVRDELFSRAPGLVMDAKFRSRWAKGEVADIVDALVQQKGYGDEGDGVFVLQPCGRTVTRRSSPLAWGAHCDHGQDEKGDHKKGHIWLGPNAAPADPQVHLRRLIAQLMQARFARPAPVAQEGRTEFLEGLFESAERRPGDTAGEDRDVPRFSASFCISCGRAHGFGDVETGKTQGKREEWSIGCKDCGMTVKRTHCYDCGSRVLFKNLLGLTYHRTIADQPTHVVCPKCGADFR